MRFLDDWFSQTLGHANNPASDNNPAQGIFVIGTDTDVGKTYVSCLMVRHLARRFKVGVYKPVMSGSILGQASDAELLNEASGGRWPIERVCPQRFKAALAPPLAAAKEGRCVDATQLSEGVLWWRNRCQILMVEGAGGAMSPLAERTTVLDLASHLGFPVVLVAAHRLGMINHILLTLEAAERRNLKTLALVVNEVTPPAGAVVDNPLSALQLSDSLKCLRPFSQNLSCWSLKYGQSALSQEAS